MVKGGAREFDHIEPYGDAGKFKAVLRGAAMPHRVRCSAYGPPAWELHYKPDAGQNH
jgi:hypothetical protein